MKKINLIQTGGTIAMNHRNKTPKLNLSKWRKALYKEIPELSRIEDLQET